MSDLMFFGVLRMPFESAMRGVISQRQFYSRAQEAADRVEKLDAENKRLRTDLAQRDQSNRATNFGAECYYVVDHPSGWTIQTSPTGAGTRIAQQYGDSNLSNAHFIATACNAHLRLASSLQRLLERFEQDRNESSSGTVPQEIVAARETLASLGVK